MVLDLWFFSVFVISFLFMSWETINNLLETGLQGAHFVLLRFPSLRITSILILCLGGSSDVNLTLCFLQLQLTEEILKHILLQVKGETQSKLYAYFFCIWRYCISNKSIFFKDRQQRNIDDIQDCVRTFIEVITKMIHFKTILLLLVLFLN